MSRYNEYNILTRRR